MIASRLKSVEGFATIDVYSALPPLILSRILRKPFLYFALDDLRSVYRVPENWRTIGGRLAKVALPRLEDLLLRLATTTYAPTTHLATAFSQRVDDPNRVQLLLQPIDRVKVDKTLVAKWRTQLSIDGKVAAVFLGNCRTPIQMRAARFIATTVAPFVESSNPNIVFIFVGPGTESLPTLTSNVRALGPVEDISPLLSACTFGLAPMDSPGGTSNKILYYLRHGLTVIATREAWNNLDDSSVIITPLPDFSATLLRMAGNTLKAATSNPQN
jgi:hypothetical protein